MSRESFVPCALAALFAAPSLLAQEEPASQEPASESAPTVAELLADYHPQSGVARIGSVATVALADGWVWLGDADARRFLSELGNQPGPQIRGIALPPDFAEANVFAVYSYSDEGHVSDDEAPDYDELLRQMQDNAQEESAQRKKAGLPTVEMLGWAEAPHYDRAQHKLYWAERLRFEGEPGETLNYNVRVLGRSGILVVNGVGAIEQLPLVAQHSKELLRVTEFVEGQRYDDFDPGIDKVAAYGIGGLIAGKLALKAGLFKVLLKPLLAGLVILGGVLWKVLGARRRTAAAAQAAE